MAVGAVDAMGASRLPEGWSAEESSRFPHGVLLRGPAGRNFYSRRAAIEFMVEVGQEEYPATQVTFLLVKIP